MNPVEQKLEQELEQRLRFEALISQLLARFLNAADPQLDSEIENAIRRLVEFLGLDQGILVQWGEDASRVVPTHSWTAPGCTPVPVGSGRVFVPWMHSQSVAGKTVLFSHVDELPPEAEEDKGFLRKAGTKAMISLPLNAGGRIKGVLVLANQRGQTAWPQNTVRQLKLIADVFAGIAERKRKQLELEERLRFEALMAELSVRFINLSADEVDGAIEAAQRHFCEILGLDRSSLFQQFDEETQGLLLTHLYDNGEDALLPRRLQKHMEPKLHSNVYWLRTDTKAPPTYAPADAKVRFPWVYRQLQREQSVVISCLEDLPEEAAADREMFRLYGTRSTVVVPLRTGGKWLGCLSFATLREPRTWSALDVRCFEFIAHIFANALARKRADEALQESEERLSLATESAGIGLWSKRIGNDDLWGTPRVRELFQLEPKEELTGESFARKIFPEDRERLRQALQQAIQTGEDLRVEFRIALTDGDMRWILARGRRRCDAAGKPQQFMGALVDVTQRKRAEEAQRQSEERLRLVLEANSEGVWDWNIPSGQTYFSPRYAAMLGYSPEEFVTHHTAWQALVHPEDFERVNQAHLEHIQNGNELCVEFRMRKKTGDWCWVQSRGTVVERDSQGRAIRMVGTHLDITARKQAEDRAQESEQRFLLMANSAPVLIWAAGPDKLCTFVNQPWLDFTGRTLEQELGEGWAEGIHPDDREKCFKIYQEAFDARRPCSLEYRLRRYDGQYRWVSDHGVARYDSKQNFAGYVGSCVDITERKQAEAEAQRSQQELAHVGRVSTLGELAGSLAHELNQPLTAILSNAQAAQRFLNHSPSELGEVGAILGDIVEESRRAGEVIVRMRLMLKKGEAQMLPLNLNLLIRQVLGLIHSELLVRNVAVTTRLAPRLPMVRGDRVQLQQVLLNLVMNACDAMNGKPGSKHELTVETKYLEEGQVQVAVRDCGSGFSREMLERPFEPFRTTKPHGLGLGLPICRSIISAHGGQLWLANNGGHEGATAYFALAAHQKEST